MWGGGVSRSTALSAYGSRIPEMMATCAPLLIAICTLAPFACLLWPDDRVIPANDWISCDYASYQLPIRRFAREEFLAGRFPHWVPFLGCGSPLHASLQATLCHPVVTPLVLLCGADYGLKAAIFLHLIFGWIGTYRLARAYDISRPSSALAGLIVTWSGFSLGHLMSGHVIFSIQYALIPWFMLALTRLLRRPGPLPAAALAAISACFVFSGHPQIFLYTLLLGLLWTAGSLAAGDGAGQRRAVIGWGFSAALAGMLLSAVQTLPTAELAVDALPHSRRTTSEHAGQFCLDGIDLLRLLSPNIIGNPFTGPAPLTRGDHYHEQVVYLGLAPLLLSVFGLSRATAARWQWGAAWLIVLFLAIGLGHSTPLFDWLAKGLPGLRLFRCHGRIFCATSVLTALLAAKGLDALIKRDLSGGGPLVGLAALLWAVANLGAFAFWSNMDLTRLGRIVAFARDHAGSDLIISAGFCLFALLIMAIAPRLNRAIAGSGYAAMIVLTICDLGYFNAREFKLAPFSAAVVPDDLLAIDPPIRFADDTDFPRVGRAPLQYSRLVPTAIAAHRGLVGTNDGGLLPAATERLFKEIQARPIISLQLAGCSHGCVPKTNQWRALPPPIPRIRFISKTSDSFERIPIDRFDETMIARLRESLDGNVQILSETPQRLSLHLDAVSPGCLVLADIWYPGWTCEVDGIERPIRQAHEVFRGVDTDVGSHQIVFAFRPRSFRYGCVATVIGGIIEIGLLCVGLRRRRATERMQAAIEDETLVRAATERRP